MLLTAELALQPSLDALHVYGFPSWECSHTCLLCFSSLLWLWDPEQLCEHEGREWRSISYMTSGTL